MAHVHLFKDDISAISSPNIYFFAFVFTHSTRTYFTYKYVHIWMYPDALYIALFMNVIIFSYEILVFSSETKDGKECRRFSFSFSDFKGPP